MAYKDTDQYREHHRKYMAVWYQKNKKRHMSYTIRNARARRDFLKSLKAGKACSCGESHPACLDWHHRDKGTKLFNIGASNSGLETTLAEIAKCDLICANCHRKLHYEERLLQQGDGASLSLIS